MTGNSDLRERLGAVFFAFIMVTSMVAVGMAGFAGSAAATQGDTYPDTEPGNLTVFVIDDSGTIQENFSVDTNNEKILRNGTDVFGGINSTLNNTAKVIEFAANNATSTNNTVVVGPGEYNVSSAAGVGTDIKVENSDVSRIYAHNQTSDAADRTELNTTDGSVTSLIELNDGSLSSLEIGATGSNAPSQAGGIFFNSSQAGSGVDALNVTNTADSFSLTFENNNVSVGSADGVVFNGQSTAPSVTVNSNTLTGVTSFVNVTGVVDNATVSGSITGIGSETGLNFTNSSANLTVDGLSLTDLGDGVNVTDADTSVDLSGVSTDNTANGLVTATGVGFDVTVTGSSSFSNDGTALNVSHNGNVTVDSTTTIDGAAVGVDLNSTGNFANLDPTINNATTVGVRSTSNSTNVTLSSATFDGSGVSGDIGLNFTANSTQTSLSVGSGTSFTGLDDAAIQLNTNRSDNIVGSVTIDGATFADSSGDGVNITSGFGNETVITDATFNNVSTGVNVDSVATGFNLTAHFNSFTDNTNGVLVDDANADAINVTFNDFVGNTDGLNVQNSNAPVNATYSWWGDVTGPNATSLQTYGNGDNVTVGGGSANVFPFLQQSTSEFSTAERNGEVGVLIEDPSFPQSNENATVTVTVLNESAGVSFSDIDGVNSDATVETSPSGSGTLSPSNVATFELSTNQKGTYSSEVLITDISNPTGDQKFTGPLSSTEITADSQTIAAGETVNVSVQALDADEANTERQNLSVTYSNSGFPDAGVNFAAPEGNTSNAGEATARIESTGSLTPGQEFSIDASIGDTQFQSLTFTTQAGAPDAASSSLSVAGGGDSTQQVNSTLDVSAQINDTDGNPLEGETVQFTSNATDASFGSDSVETNANGFANTTVTLPTSTDVGTIAVNASVGDFSPDNTGRATVNVTTTATAPTQLGFATDVRSFAPSATQSVDIEVQDEFGNANTSAGVNSGITVTSSDTGVISVSGVNDLDSNNAETFTLTGESAGTATINVTSDDSDIASVEAEFTVSEPAALQLSPAHNVATVEASNANSNTANQAVLEAQLVDDEGNALGISGENITFAKQTGSAAELNQSNADFTVQTVGTGNATILVNGTSTTGETTFIALAENYSVQGSATVTTTGAADSISVTPETSSVAANETANVTVEFVDSEGRNVPRVNTNVQLSADNGAVDDSPQQTGLANGAVTATLTYNATDASAGSATLTALGGGLSGTADVTVSGQADTGSPLGGTAGEYDADGDGQITIQELADAGSAYTNGELTIQELAEVGSAYTDTN